MNDDDVHKEAKETRRTTSTKCEDERVSDRVGSQKMKQPSINNAFIFYGIDGNILHFDITSF